MGMINDFFPLVKWKNDNQDGWVGGTYISVIHVTHIFIDLPKNTSFRIKTTSYSTPYVQ